MAEFVSGALNSVVFWEAKTPFTQRRSAQPFPNGYHLSDTKLAVVPKWGDRIAVCDFHDDIVTWSFLLHKDGGNFTCGSLLHSSRYLVSGCGDSSVLIWDLKSKNIIKTFQGHSSAVTSVARSSNDHLVVSGSRDGSILMHTVSSSASHPVVHLTKDQPLNQVINRLRFSSVEKSQVGCVTEDGVVSLWSVESQRMLMKFSRSHTNAATDLCFSPNNNMLMVSVGMDAKIKCYDIQSRKLVTEITTPAPLSSVVMLRDGHTLVGGGTDGKLYVYELQSVKTPREVIDAHQTAVTCIAEQSFSKSSSRKSSAKASRSRSQHSPRKQPPSILESSPERKDLTTYSQQSLSSPLRADTTQDTGSAQNPMQHSHPQYIHPSKQGPPLSQQEHSDMINPLIAQFRSGLVQHPSGGDFGSVTPYVTSQQVKSGSSLQPIPEAVPALDIQTPFNYTKSGGTLPAQPPPPMVTPAFTHTLGHMSGIFSPLDDHTLSVGKVTASVAPTVRATPLDTHQTVQPSSVNGAQYVAGMSGLFSPLDSHAMMTPHHVHGGVSNTSLNVSMRATKVEPGAGDGRHHAKSEPKDTASQQELRQSEIHVEELESDPTTGNKDVAAVLPHEITAVQGVSEPMSQAVSAASSIQSSDIVPSSQTPVSAPSLSSSQVVGDAPRDSSTREEITKPTTTTTSGGVQATGIQMQFLESKFKDLQEDIWYSVHRDIRALSVDMIKQFFAMQQQSAAQFNALNEKVERLTEDNRRLQEMVHQYMPKH